MIRQTRKDCSLVLVQLANRELRFPSLIRASCTSGTRPEEIDERVVPPQRHIELVRSASAMPRPFTKHRKGTDDEHQEETAGPYQAVWHIFADLGLPNAEEHQLRAALVIQLKWLVTEPEVTKPKPPSLVGLQAARLIKVALWSVQAGFGGKAHANADCIRPGCGNQGKAAS